MGNQMVTQKKSKEGNGTFVRINETIDQEDEKKDGYPNINDEMPASYGKVGIIVGANEKETLSAIYTPEVGNFYFYHSDWYTVLQDDDVDPELAKTLKDKHQEYIEKDNERGTTSGCGNPNCQNCGGQGEEGSGSSSDGEDGGRAITRPADFMSMLLGGGPPPSSRRGPPPARRRDPIDSMSDRVGLGRDGTMIMMAMMQLIEKVDALSKKVDELSAAAPTKRQRGKRGEKRTNDDE